MLASESAWRFATTVRQHSAQESNCFRGKRYQPTNHCNQAAYIAVWLCTIALKALLWTL